MAVLPGNYSRDAAGEAARRMWEEARPDAIFAGNDHMAFAVMDALRHGLGLDVPGDVSVVGYDDVPLAAWPAYDLTTVRQSSGQMVKTTVDLLMERIEGGESAPRKVELEGPLIVRGSARVPEGWE